VVAAAFPQTDLRGLYVILDPDAAHGRSLIDLLNAAAAGGATLFQYRAKRVALRDAYRQAQALRQAAADAGGRLIVNDRCDLALAVEADGVHLGQDDLPVEEARVLLGKGKLIGLSTHTAAQVKRASTLDVDYLGFGPIFTPFSKRDHDPVVGLDGLRTIRALTAKPIFAIGGIAVDSAGEVIRAGANGVAVISAIAQAPDVTGTARAFVALFR